MSNIYPKGFPQRTDEFKKSQNIKQEFYNFLKDTMEEASEKAFKANQTERSEKRAIEEIEQSTKDRARRDVFLAKERVMAEAQEARKLREKQQQQT